MIVKKKQKKKQMKKKKSYRSRVRGDSDNYKKSKV